MTEIEKNRKMALDYLEAALALKRSIAKLRNQRQNIKRLSDRTVLDRKIEGLECSYYDQIWAMDADCIRNYLTVEELGQIRQANREVSSVFVRREERKREIARRSKQKRKARMEGEKR